MTIYQTTFDYTFTAFHEYWITTGNGIAWERKVNIPILEVRK